MYYVDRYYHPASITPEHQIGRCSLFKRLVSYLPSAKIMHALVYV